MTPLGRTRWLTLGALALGACNDPPTAPPPDQLVVTKSAGLVGAPGFPLMDTIFVRVLDADGKARVGVEVNWVVRDGGGSVFPLSEVSGTDGTTAAIWTLGPRPGYNELRVSISEEASHTFTATGEVFRPTEVVGNFYVGCGLVDGAIWCWGRGSPIWGVPTSNYDSAPAKPPYDYTSIGPALYDDAREYTDLAIGRGGGVCALDTTGAVWCGPPSASGPPAIVVGFPPIRRGSLVGDCGIADADGRAWCWDGSSVTMVAGSPAFSVLRMVDFGRYYCGLQADSTAACWGDSPPGNGSPIPSPTPVTVSGGHRFVDLVVGEYFGCGRTPGGELWCWGTNYTGQPVWLEPRLAATGVTFIGASWSTVIVGMQGRTLIRRLGPDLRPEDWSPPLTGLENVAVAGVAEGGMGCVLGAENEVYCVREQWDPWTGTDYYGYFPVMPVRQAPPAPAVLR